MERIWVRWVGGWKLPWHILWFKNNNKKKPFAFWKLYLKKHTYCRRTAWKQRVKASARGIWKKKIVFGANFREWGWELKETNAFAVSEVNKATSVYIYLEQPVTLCWVLGRMGRKQGPLADQVAERSSFWLSHRGSCAVWKRQTPQEVFSEKLTKIPLSCRGNDLSFKNQWFTNMCNSVPSPLLSLGQGKSFGEPKSKGAF